MKIAVVTLGERFSDRDVRKSLASVATHLETLAHENRKPVDKHIFKRYAKILSTPTFIHYDLYASFGVTTCFSFFSVSPFIIIKLLGVSQEYFGYCFAVFGMVLIFGGMLASRCIAKIGIDKTITTRTSTWICFTI